MQSDKDEFNKESTHPLQSWEWGEFRKRWGNEVVRFPFGQITFHKLPIIGFKVGAFIKGSVPTKEMLSILKDYAGNNDVVFYRMEPNCQKDEKVISLLKKAGAVPGRRLFTPTTFWIDLTKSEEELLKSFSSKTRYNIRVAQKHGVTVSEDNSDKAFKEYLQLTKETAERQGFYAHSQKYHKLMWEELHKAGIAHLLTAKYKGEIITTWIVFTWKNFLYYPYGASSDQYKNVMANNLMMWEAIKFGKKNGLTTFDLWGREEGKGFTKFKEGYNPKVIEFIGTWDLVNVPLYYHIYILAEKIRWFILKTLAKLGLSKKKFSND
jgi:lipid II:glycine glycyltransferase (peptidoglycan interpeptide bridge formation enzyme)